MNNVRPLFDPDPDDWYRVLRKLVDVAQRQLARRRLDCGGARRRHIADLAYSRRPQPALQIVHVAQTQEDAVLTERSTELVPIGDDMYGGEDGI